MCNSCPTENHDPFASLESDFEGTASAAAPVSTEDYLQDASNRAVKTGESTTQQRIEVRCEKCRGTGTFYGYSGRAIGACFACKGAGKFLRAPGYVAAKAKRAEAKVAKAAAHQQTLDTWAAQNKDVFEWLVRASARGFNFATSLLESLSKYAELTPNQHAAAVRCMTQDAERAAAKAAQVAPATGAPVTGLDLTNLPAGRYAVPDGETRLKIMVRRPGPDSKWHGFTFVSDAAEYGQRQNYGKQAPGRAYEGKLVEQLKIIMADPHAASIAYGKLTGTCGVCGRHLEDAESVAAGIGPICAAKF